MEQDETKTQLTAGRRWRWGWILAVYWIALATATHIPPDRPILPGGNFDKLAHLTAYAILAFLIATYWQSSAGWLGREHFFWIVVACSAYGVIDELMQIPVGRDSNLFDWVADALGALLGVTIFVAWRRYQHRRPAD
jgi:VanZ family protein